MTVVVVMDINFLKENILNNNKIVDVLNIIGCHHIQFHHGSQDDYFTCGNKDGNNPNAITVYCNENLKCINYTRELNSKKENHDIIDLVMFAQKINFFEALNLLCDIAGLNYYGLENEVDLPESIKLVQYIANMDMVNEEEYAEDTKLEPKPESILKYYQSCVNDLFKEDGISYRTQLLFEIGYDHATNLITIPIRDELNHLVGVKARVPDADVIQNKYTYLIRCPRGKILYNLFRAYPYIQAAGYVIVVESEKAVMQLYDMGIRNVIALSGSKLTSVQLRKIMDLHVDVVFALDKDVKREKIQEMANRFPLGYNIYALIDTLNILEEKESPSDNPEKWKTLWENCEVKL